MDFDDSIMEYYHYRALIEEFNANITVENFMCDAEGQKKSLWIVFDPSESTPERVVDQVYHIASKHKIEVLVLRIGISHSITFLRSLRGFFKLKVFDVDALTKSHAERHRISKSKVISEVKTLFFEHKRRSLYYGNNKISRPGNIAD